MQRFLRRLWWAVTTPFRILAWPFRALSDFINYEPEDAPAGEVFARSIEQPSLLIEHLEALRRHLLRSVVFLIVTTGFSFAFASRILEWLTLPIGGLDSLRAIEVTESIGAFMRVSLLSGFVLAFPYMLFEFFLFINPGLKRRERVLVLIAVPSSMVLFLTGLAFARFVMLEPALDLLLGFMGIETVPRPSNYITFVTGLMFWIGVSFQFPLVMYALAAMGIVRARTLLEGWRIAIVAIAILAAAVTPTIDPVNMGLVMLPMTVLYFLSIGLARLAERARSRPALSQQEEPIS